MKRFNYSKISMVLIVVAAAIVLAENANADFTFGEPVNLRSTIPILDYTADFVDCFSPDGLEMYFLSYRPGGYGDLDIWVAKRTSIGDNWGSIENLGAGINSPMEDSLSFISTDGLTLYFSSNRPGGSGNYDLYTTTRATRDSPWGQAVNMGPNMNYSGGDGGATVSPNGIELYFESRRSGGYGRGDIWVAKRQDPDGPWGTPTNLGTPVNTAYGEEHPFLTPDGLIFFFDDVDSAGRPSRPGGYGNTDIWMTKRANLSAPWETPVNLGPKINGSSSDVQPRISWDGHVLYFVSLPTTDPNTWCFWQVPILPCVDFNGDGKVDLQDLVILISRWGTGSDICDIGPMPWGDGTVDENDLKVLMDYWGQDFNDLPFDLVSYWKLDESADDIFTEDSVGNKDGIIFGNPIWQPQGGKINGAIQLDGIDDYISTPFVLNPADGPFSVYAWVKGGAPGQVILSQIGNKNFLSADSSSGNLMVGLNGGRGKELVSQTVITDGSWHHVGLVWDGSYRTLYVDDEIAAIDTSIQSTLYGSTNGLYIGCGKDKAAGSFWTGLIDDVRIYNRVITP